MEASKTTNVAVLKSVQAGGHKLKRSLTKEPALPTAAEIANEKYAANEAVIAVGGIAGSMAAPASAAAGK